MALFHIYLFIIIVVLLESCYNDRIRRRVDSSEYDYENWGVEPKKEEKEMDFEKMNETEKKNIFSKLSLIKRFINPTNVDPRNNFCKEVPCSWTFYTELKDGNREVILSFNNRLCTCKKNTSCQYYDDNVDIDAFVYRCLPD